MSFFDQFQSKTIRRDVEGLRAVAVLSVMLYHFDIAPFSGGFVGVDIFFVISGYLISHQIKSEIELGTFSIAFFYERRIRRILPALYTCLIVSYGTAYFIFFPPEMEAFANSVFATVAFFANIHFWKAYQNYFAPASEMAPLLHTWSLAVEEQFYFLAPACLLILSRLKRNIFSALIVAGLLLSLGLAEWMIRHAPSLAFYFTPARAWEFLIGTLLAFEPRIAERFQHRSLALWIGAICLLAPIFMFYSGIRFPGVYAIIPVFGAFIIIAFGKYSPTHPVVSWLSVRPMTLIGLLSYSLYLWHWPILVFAKTSLGDDLSLITRILLLACVGLVATFFYIVIEHPIRKKKILPGRMSFLGTMGSVSLVLLLYAHFDAKRGGETFKPQSLDLKLETSADIFDMNCFLIGDTSSARWNENACRLADGRRSKILLWGDSTAAHYGYGIKKIAPFYDATVYLYTMSACLPIFGYETLGRPLCRQFNDDMLSHAKRLGIEKIVVAGRWDTAYRSHVGNNSIADTIAELKRNGFQVEILASTPLFKRDLRSTQWDHIARGGSPEEGFALVDQKYNNWLIYGLAPENVINPLDHLCRSGACPYRLRNQFLFIDGVHLSRFGSEYAVRSYFPFE